MGIFSATISAIRKGMARTREAISGGLRGLLAGRSLDEDLIDDIEAYLIKADVGVAATRDIIADLRTEYRSGRVKRGEDAIDRLKGQLKGRWEAVDRSIATAPSPPTVILVAGTNGVGKTTSVAKIAKALKDEGRSVLMVAADTFRAGAVAQLTEWARRLDVEIVKGRERADPAAVAYDGVEAAVARGVDVVLIDTAGRLHADQGLMRQLTKIRDVVAKRIDYAPHEVLLVLDATAGQNAIAQAKSFNEAIDVTGIFLAKLDGTAKGGVVVAIRDELGIPVKLIGVGERPEDVEPFDPDEFVEAMFDE